MSFESGLNVSDMYSLRLSILPGGSRCSAHVRCSGRQTVFRIGTYRMRFACAFARQNATALFKLLARSPQRVRQVRLMRFVASE